MPLPKEVTFVTFDVYGTLIDWETGVYDAFAKEADKDGYTLSRDELIPLFLQIQQEIKGGSYELYAEVLRRTAVQISKQLGWPLEPSRSGFLPDSRQALAAVQGDQHAARPLRQEVRGRADLERRRQAARRDAAPLQGRLRPRRHRPAGALLQAGPGALQGGRAADRRQEGLGARRLQLLLRRRAVPEGEGPGDLGQPQQGDARLRARRSRPRRSRPSSRRRSCSAPPEPMKAVGLHPDVIVVTSRFWQTTCTLVRSGEEAFCIDSPVLPDELELLPAVAQQAGFRVVGCLATHADWDHLLGRYAFPDAPLGRRRVERRAAAQRAGRGAARAARLRRGALRRAARRRCRSPTPQALPVPGHCGIGERELELHPADGHTVDGMAILDPVGARARRAATTSRRSRSRGSPRAARRRAYLATLDRLEPLVERAEHVVPGPRRGARRRARARDPARGPRLPGGAARAGRGRAAAARAPDRARSARSTPRTSPAYRPSRGGRAAASARPAGTSTVSVVAGPGRPCASTPQSVTQ